MARAWYSHLESRSIDSFAQLEKQLVVYFNTYRRMPREPDSLFAIRQQDKEPLKDYVARFKAATLEVYNLDESLVMSALKWGLRTFRLTYSLDKTPTKSYAEVLARAEKYIRADEGAASRREAEGKPSTKKPREDPQRFSGSKPGPSRPSSPSRPCSPRRAHPVERPANYTPLLAPRSNPSDNYRHSKPNLPKITPDGPEA